jgi:hypothetical protein
VVLADFFVEILFIVPVILWNSKKLSSFLLLKYNIWYPRSKASNVAGLTPRCNLPQSFSKTYVCLISTLELLGLQGKVGIIKPVF